MESNGQEYYDEPDQQQSREDNSESDDPIVPLRPQKRFKPTCEDADDEDDEPCTFSHPDLHRVPCNKDFRAGAFDPNVFVKTPFEQMREEQIKQGLTDRPWAPFDSRAEWELAQFLFHNTTQKATDEYCKLDIVS